MPFIDRSPLESPINTAVSLRRWKDTRAPTVADYKQFKEGDFWLHSNVALGDTTWYICAYKDASSAIWEQFASTTGTENFLTDDGLPAVEPDVTGQIDILGGEGIDVTGTGPGNIITVAGEDATITNKGIGELSTDLETIDGTQTDNHFINPSSLKAKLGVQTAKAIPYGAGTAAAIAWTNALTDGQIPIGSTAGTPQAGNIVSADGSVIITESANAIDLKTGGTISSTFSTDSGDATPSAGVLNVLGGDNIATSGAGNTETISLSGTTDHAVQVGNATGSLTSLGVATDGQLVIGSTGANPVVGSLTSTGGTVAITLGAGAVNLESGSTTASSVPTDSGTATPSAGELTLAGGTNINTAGAGSTATTNLDDDIELTSVKATTFDTNIATAKVTLSGTAIASSGTDANIDIPITAKGTGTVNPNALSVNSAYTFPTVDGTASQVQKTDGAGVVTWEDDGSGTGTTSVDTDVGTATPVGGVLTLGGGTNTNTEGSGSTAKVNLDADIELTSVKATTFDTNVASAGVTLAGTSLIADGTDANIPINFIPKGTSGLEVDKASGDSFIHFTSGVGDGVFVGLDESDGKRFKMGNGADPSASAFFWQDPSSGWMWFLGTQAGTSAAEWHFEASNAGQTNRLYVANDDNTNVASNASIGAWTPSGGGDCFTQWRVASVKSYSMGIDQSDANSLKITYDSAGGPCISPSSGVEFLKFTTAGAMTINEAYTFPTADGSADQVLTTDGSGAVTWEDGGGSSGDTVQTLTDAASIAWNITSGEIGIVTLGGNRALANPTNIVAGGRYTLIAKQDGTGSRTLSYGTYFKFPGAVTPVLTTNASAVDMVEFIAESTILLRCVNVIYDSK